MAERKSTFKRAPRRPELEKRLEEAKTVVMTEDQLKEQRASFAYGNAPQGSRITKESALAAAGYSLPMSSKMRSTTSSTPPKP